MLKWEACIQYAFLPSMTPIPYKSRSFQSNTNSVASALVHRGPAGTPYECGVFQANLIFPDNYPLSPPKMIFTSEIWHPNGM